MHARHIQNGTYIRTKIVCNAVHEIAQFLPLHRTINITLACAHWMNCIHIHESYGSRFCMPECNFEMKFGEGRARRFYNIQVNNLNKSFDEICDIDAHSWEQWLQNHFEGLGLYGISTDKDIRRAPGSCNEILSSIAFPHAKFASRWYTYGNNIVIYWLINLRIYIVAGFGISDARQIVGFMSGEVICSLECAACGIMCCSML